MELSESEANVQVKELQAALFPPTTKSASSYFSNFMIKPAIVEDDQEQERETRLRELVSRELLALSKEAFFVPQAPRWPTECQVLEERVRHIPYVPPTPEPYYVPTGNEVQPQPTGDECGIVVYQYTPVSAVNYFSRSAVGGSRYLLNPVICPEEDTLRFESRFESGNLARAVRITSSYYELHLRADLYTGRHMQWFYFQVKNMKKNFLYRFSIVNFTKPDSLYSEGMRPLMYSMKDSQLHQVGWRRCGDNITYFCNDNEGADNPDQQTTFTLTFTVEFPHDDDEVYLANCYPYTYSDLEDHLLEISTHPIKSTFTAIRLLCKSLAGNNVHYITITTPPGAGDMQRKRAIVITARVHPGESPASWMMKGILDFLTGDSGPAKELRDKFIFKLVPMLNPDGVIVGNNRCSLSAKDLNRQYRSVMRDVYPSIWYTKLMIRRLLEECGVAMYCDLHSHSRKHNIFIYGCESRKGSETKLQEQVFPLMLHKNTAEKFSFESCQFRIQKNKEGTGRIVMWMMGIANSYTLEASFAGSTLSTRAETHFSTLDYEQMGRSFCQTLLDFYDDDPRKEKLRIKIINRLVKEGSNADEPTNIRLSDYTSDDGDTSSSSSNEVGRDEDDDEFVLPLVPPSTPILNKKKPPKVIQQSNKSVSNKSPNLSRKPLPMCTATLKLHLAQKCDKDSFSSSDETDVEAVKKPKFIKKKRKKNRNSAKNKRATNYELGCEIIETKMKTISIYDLTPSVKLCSRIANKARMIQPLHDRKSLVSRQLAEVQARLLTLKNKLWMGCGAGDEPLSWGNLASNKTRKKKLARDAHNEKTSKNDNRVKSLSRKSKPTNGLKKQATAEWSGARLKKSKSLPDKLAICGSHEDIAMADTNAKKTRKRGKFTRKAKAVHKMVLFQKD